MIAFHCGYSKLYKKEKLSEYIRLKLSYSVDQFRLIWMP